ncbi:hypothetical protein [Fusobacterium sp.]|uniref:hypothetical protein n=1 Tax=Fusobacterium sp. TaxID=68766 RepID=UPI00263319E3|nr:hypothetical protein [Fusobacterium sp.]
MYNETTNEWFKDYKIEKEIRRKENKTKMEKLFLEMENYNSMVCEINVDYSKQHFSESRYYEERLENFKKHNNLFSNCKEIYDKIKFKIDLNESISNFETMFIKEYKELEENVVADLIISITTKIGGK